METNKKSYFTIEELCKSSIAKKHKINNTPDDAKILDNINYLILNLNTLREAWGSPVIVSSGYRCDKLNKLVGGSKTSSHMQGLSADIVPKDIKDLPKFKIFCREFYKYHDFDQCINEPNWVHLGFDKRMRCQFLKTSDGKTYLVWNQE